MTAFQNTVKLLQREVVVVVREDAAGAEKVG
jgi:hypothetical protein